MRSILKYQVPVNNVGLEIDVPTGSTVRFVGQQGLPTLWMECDTDAPHVSRRFRIFGTGHSIPDGFVYVGTTFDGPYVWHVFEQR